MISNCRCGGEIKCDLIFTDEFLYYWIAYCNKCGVLSRSRVKWVAKLKCKIYSYIRKV